jgi:hypothetical protein
VKLDAIGGLLRASETLRNVAAELDVLQSEIGNADTRQDLRNLVAELRYRSFSALSLGAGELRRTIVQTPRVELPDLALPAALARGGGE